MHGEKITQLQDAMFTVLDDMKEQDYFSILTFNSAVQVFFESLLEIHRVDANVFSDLDV